MLGLLSIPGRLRFFRGYFSETSNFSSFNASLSYYAAVSFVFDSFQHSLHYRQKQISIDGSRTVDPGFFRQGLRSFSQINTILNS